MHNKTCVITGANAGIGYATVLGLAKMGVRVVMVCRSRERGEKAQADIRRDSRNEAVDLRIADLASQADIRRLADEVIAQYDRLDVLLNNAGIITRTRTVTEDGFETQFAVNHLAPFLLTNLLLDHLRASAPARIVTVASNAHRMGSIDFDDLQSARSYSPRGVYGMTKLANILFTYELARRIEGSGVTANCLHPGVIATNLLRSYMGLPEALGGVNRLVFGKWESGAQTSIYLASSPEVEGVSGKYFADRQATKSSAATHDEATARRLWAASAKLTGIANGDQG